MKRFSEIMCEMYSTRIRPPMVTLTHAIQLPSWGGDTSFISLHAAYEGLSPNLQQYLEGLVAVP